MPQDGKLPVEEGYQNRVAAPASAATEGREIPSFCGNKAIEGGYHYAKNQYTNHCINYASLSTSCSSHPTRGGWIEIRSSGTTWTPRSGPTLHGVGGLKLMLHAHLLGILGRPTPHGVGGLKWWLRQSHPVGDGSHPTRGGLFWSMFSFHRSSVHMFIWHSPPACVVIESTTLPFHFHNDVSQRIVVYCVVFSFFWLKYEEILL